jgi:hypothetical protein
MIMNENLTKEIIENKNEISALHILLIIILITVDYISMFNYGIELKSFKLGLLKIPCQSDKIISRIDNGRENKL